MAFDNLHNYYEQLVFARLDELRSSELINAKLDFLEDVACVALNHLPTRYVRYSVDMAFYLSPAERERMNQDVHNAVRAAIDFIKEHQRRPTPDKDIG